MFLLLLDALAEADECNATQLLACLSHVQVVAGIGRGSAFILHN